MKLPQEAEEEEEEEEPSVMPEMFLSGLHMTLECTNTKLWAPRFWVRANVCLHPAKGAEPTTTKPTASHRIIITRIGKYDSELQNSRRHARSIVI